MLAAVLARVEATLSGLVQRLKEKYPLTAAPGSTPMPPAREDAVKATLSLLFTSLGDVERHRQLHQVGRFLLLAITACLLSGRICYLAARG